MKVICEKADAVVSLEQGDEETVYINVNGVSILSVDGDGKVTILEVEPGEDQKQTRMQFNKNNEVITR